MSDTTPPVKATPIEGLIIFLQGIQDGELDREEFVEAADSTFQTGAFEMLERAAWGAIYDLAAPLVRRINLPEIRWFKRRTPAELREAAAEAEAAGKTKKAAQLRATADKREAKAAEGV